MAANGKEHHTMGTIFSRVKLSSKQVFALLALMLLSAVTAMLLPTALASMIDVGVAQENRSAILIIAAVMAVLALLGCLFNIAATVLSARISTKFAADLRREVFHRVQDLSAAEVEKFGTASLVTRSTSDVTNVQMFLSLLLRLGVTAPLMAVAGLVLSSLTGGELSSVLNLAIPALLLGAGAIVIFVSRYSVALRQKIDRLNKRFLETLEGVRVIRAFNQQEKEMARFDEANGDLAALTIRSGRVSALLMPVIQVIFGVTTAAVMGMGAWYVSTGEMDVGALVANSQYISMILAAIMMLALVILLFPMSYACARRIAEVLNAESSIQSGNHSASERPERASVVFDHVTFAYPGADEPVLKDISFESHAGEVTAIIGRTGCGKSSVLKLVPRLYDAMFGHIYVDGMDVKKYKLEELRSLIGYVPQKNVLFSGDVASNLRFGDEQSGEEQWREAAHIACADEFIEQKDGAYHAAIAQGGTNLSGGQRQRMAIARAVVKQPEIYLFDDSFSALDMKTDRTLRARLRENMGGATMLIVAQRVSTILDADRILVMEDGQIVGNGTHKELLRTCALYREIAQLQLGEEEVAREIACV